MECKSRKSRNTWSNRQTWPWSTEWSRAKAIRVCAKITHWSWQIPSSKNTREDSSHEHHQMVNTKIRLIIFFAAKDGEALYSQQKQALELTVAQIMNSLMPNSDLYWRKRKTTRPFRYDLYQILYDYTVEVTSRLKGLDMIECLKNYGRRFITLYRRQWPRLSTRKRNAKRESGCLRRAYK